MAELTQNQVERRFQIATSNPVPVNIPGLDGLFFRPLTGGQKGISSLTYNKAYMRYIKEGLVSARMVPDLLKASVEGAGMSMKVLQRYPAILKKQRDALTDDLMGPYDQLTPDEVAELPPELQLEREEKQQARGRKIVETMVVALDDEEKAALAQIHHIEDLEQAMLEATAERAAKRDTYLCEILMGAVRESGVPYFASADEMAAVDPPRALVDLFSAWDQFREGKPSDFFSRS